MKNYKKRLRLLAEKHRYLISYGSPQQLQLKQGNCIVEFTATGVTEMRCRGAWPGHAIEILTRKEFVFSLFGRFASASSREGLEAYSPKHLITIDDVIEEYGDSQFQQFLAHIRSSPDTNEIFGGSRFSAEHYRGVLILSDDLMQCEMNVVEVPQ